MTLAPSKTILIVDDDLAIRRLIELCLRALPAAQIAASEGRAALEVLRREKVDLIVTDLVMPGASGFDIVRSVREDAALQSIPVVMLSSIGNPDLPAEATRLGVQAYFGKPFSPSQLISTVRGLLGL